MYNIQVPSTLTHYFTYVDIETSLVGSGTLHINFRQNSVFVLCDQVISSIHHLQCTSPYHFYPVFSNDDMEICLSESGKLSNYF